MNIMKKSEADILISGGGIAGLTLGILLAQAGLNTHLIDTAPPANDMAPSGRTVALMENSLNVLRATGVWEKIKNFTAPLEVMRIIDASMPQGGMTEADFAAEDIGLKQFGFNIPNSVLRKALYEIAQKTKNLALHMPDALQSYKITNKVEAELKSGKKIDARLIVGADGRNSLVRKISSIECTEDDYGQSAITCLISHSRSHNNTATEFHRPGGPLALVPMPGNQSSVVWIEPTHRADALMSLKKNEFTQSLQNQTHDILGGLVLESPPECWPLKTLKAKTLVADHAVLMAEAAHVISPITAQGLNLSLRDVAALAETLVDSARAGIDIAAPTILKQYEKRRRVDIGTRVFGVNKMNTIVSTDVQALKGLRRAGLKTLDAITPAKKFAMRIGLAPAIDAGRLARGDKL